MPDTDLSGEIAVSVPAGVATDFAGNANTASPAFKIAANTVVDAGQPKITATVSCPTVNRYASDSDSIFVDVGFSSAVHIDLSGVSVTQNGVDVEYMGLTFWPGNPAGPQRYEYTSAVEQRYSGTLLVQALPGAGTGSVRIGRPHEFVTLSSTASNVMHVAHKWAVSVGDAIATEGTDATIDFTVSLNARDDCRTVTVDYATADGTATAGSDYTATSGTLTFAPGETTKTVSVPVIDDTVADSGETFTLTLSNVSRVEVKIADAEATGTILNHEAEADTTPPTPTLSCSGDPALARDHAWGERIKVTWSEPVNADPGSLRPFFLGSRAHSVTSLDSAETEAEFYVGVSSDSRSMWLHLPAGITQDASGNRSTKSNKLWFTPGCMESPPPPAEFKSIPENHDGSSAFTFELHFLENKGMGFTDVRDAMLEVSGGTVTRARRVDPNGAERNRRWEVTVRPSAAGDITITLPSRPCGETGAVCGLDGQPLPEAITATVPHVTVPLTARFENVPESHDGSSAFTFELHFSEDIPDLSYRTVAGALLDVTGATVTRAERITGGSNAGWCVTATPGGSDDITIALPARACGETAAICVGGTRSLAENLSTVVPMEATAPPPAVDSLTARFENVPEWHDGSTTFTVELHFSENVEGLSYRTVRDAFEVVGIARVSKAERITAGNNQSWRVTVEPRSASDMTITLPSRPCDESGAICTVDGTALAADVSATVKSSLFIASFNRVPRQHNGESPFTFSLWLSREPANLSYVTVRDGLLDVSGGEVTYVRRNVAGKSRNWRVTVQPSSLRDIVITVRGTESCEAEHAVCTAEGQKLPGGRSVTVRGPTAFSVADAEVQEGPDATLDFAVTLSRARDEDTTVDYATSDGTATAGSDYTATSGTLTFEAGTTSKTVSVPVLDDALDEGKETLTLTLSNPDSSSVRLADAEATGTIGNSDPLQKMWLSRFGRTVASHVTDAVSDRLAGPLAGAQVTVGGQTVNLARTEDEAWAGAALTSVARALGAAQGPGPDGDPGPGPGQAWVGGWPRTGPGLRGSPTLDSAPAREISGRELLLGSAFHLASEGDGRGPGLAAWGRVTAGGFDGEAPAEAGSVRVDGEVTTGILGADAEWNHLLAGVAVSVSEGEGTFDQPGVDSGTIESTMTTVNPYARFMVNDRVSVWGVAGWGTGDMTIVQASNDRGQPERITRTNLEMRLAALGGRGVLMEAEETGIMDLALKADAFHVETEADPVSNEGATTARAHRLRLILEGSRAFDLSEGAVLTPGLELGLRHDGGDAETGTGVELGGRVSYADPGTGLSVEARGRMLVAHADSDYEEWGASASVRLAPGERGHGLSFSLSPTLGAAASGTERLWGARRAADLAPGGGGFEAARGLQGELGYGLPLFGDRFTGTPNLGFGLSNSAREYRIGWRLTSVVRGDPGFQVDLDALRREAANGNEPVEHGMILRGAIRW